MVYECTEPDERQQFAGIRYTSRLGDEFENWAVFEPGRPSDQARGPIRDDDPDLIDAVQRLGLNLLQQIENALPGGLRGDECPTLGAI